MPKRPFDIVVTQLETAYSRPRAKCCILNPAPARRDALPHGRHPLAGVEFVIPNEHEAEVLTGHRDPARAARDLERLGASHAIITLGHEGVYDGTARRRRPAFKVKVVDTVGAGDAFIGAFAVAIGADEPDPVRFAQAVAAIKCTRRGAQSSPSRNEVRRFLAGR